MFYAVYKEGEAEHVAFGRHTQHLNVHRVEDGKMIELPIWFPAIMKFGGIKVVEFGEMELPDIIQRFGPIIPVTGEDAELVRASDALWDEDHPVSTSTEHVPKIVQRVREMDAHEVGVQMGLVAEEIERLGPDDLEAFNRAMADRMPGLHRMPEFPSVDWLRFAITSLQYVKEERVRKGVPA